MEFYNTPRQQEWNKDLGEDIEKAKKRDTPYFKQTKSIPVKNKNFIFLYCE